MLPIKNKISTAIKHPNHALRELNRLYHTQFGRKYNTAGTNIFDGNWDNLLILDACRYDMFASQSDLPGHLEYRYSLGPATPEFLKANFEGRSLLDTVYVTANPMFHRNRNDFQVELHDIIDLWATHWDDESGTVLPEDVTDKAIEISELYPHKRLVVHYIQPHYPFICSDTEWDLVTDQHERDFWRKRMEGDIDVTPEEVWPRYKENLDRALPHVREAMLELPGKTVVTSDHGNMIGERARPIPVREWGHPPGIYTKELTKVPWNHYKNSNRKKIVKEEPRSKEKDVDSKKVKKRLEMLGYK